MALGQMVRRLLPAMRNKAAAPRERKVVLADYYAAMSSAGIYTTSYRARPWPVERAVAEAYERDIWVYKAVEAIASAQARLPFRLRKGENVLDDHPLYRVLNRRANPLETGPQLRKRLSAQVLLSKQGAFAEVTAARNGDVIRMDLLPPGRTRPVPGTGADLISHFEVIRADGTRVQIDPERVRWFREPHPLDPLSGVTPLEAAGLSIELDLMARWYNTAYLKNDARPGGVLAVNGEMDETEMDRIEDRFGRGPLEAGKLTVIAGDVSYVDLATRPRDMAYEQMSTISKKEVLSAFGVPESVIGDASGRTFDNAEQEEWNFWTITMPPHLHLIATGLDDDTDDDLEGFFDTEQVTVLRRAETARRAEAREEFNAGLISPAEYREAAGYEEIDLPEARALYIPTGKTTIPASKEDEAALDEKAKQKQAEAMEAMQAQGGPIPGQKPPQDGGKPPGGRTPAKPAPEPQKPSEDDGKDEQKAAGAVESVPDLRGRDTTEQALSAALSALAVRLTSRSAARLNAPKTRKGTRHWRPDGATDTRVGVKQIDADAAVDPARWQEEAEQAAYPILEAAATVAAAGLLADFGAAAVVPPVSVAGVVAAVAASIGLAAAALATRLVRRLAAADADGADLGDMVALARGFGGEAASWSRAVAVHAATAVVNGARDAAAADYAAAEPGRAVVRVWRTRADERVRAEHRKTAGQTRPLGEPFDVGGFPLRYPGDEAGPPHLTYGCRCWLMHRSTITGRFVPAPTGQITANPYRSKTVPTLTLSLKRAAWREQDHLRGRDGRFIHSGDLVDLPGGGTGRVVGVAGGRLAIQRDDGGRELRKPSEVQRAAEKPAAGKPKAGDRVRLADGARAKTALTLSLKHLPGRHNQSTHGRGWNGGRGRRRDVRGRFTRGGDGGVRRVSPDSYAEGSYAALTVAGTTADTLPGGPGVPQVVGLDKKQWNGVVAYTSELVANDLNGQLRDGKTPKGDLGYGIWDRGLEGAELVDVLDDAISKGEFTQDVRLARGLVLTDEQAARFVPGAKVRDDGYVSSSLDEGTARKFAETRAKGKAGAGPYLLRILVPAGTNGVPGARSLQEVILARGTELTVLRKEGDIITAVIG